MKEVMGIIHHLKNEKKYEEITQGRCVAAIPYGGKYRLVDFPLSNMVNSGIVNIGVITSLNLRALVDHLGKGEEWGLDKKKGGLFFLPTAISESNRDKRRLDLEDIYVNLDYLHKSVEEYVLISGSDIVCNIDLSKVIAYHKEKKADITMVCKEGYKFSDKDIEQGVYLEKLTSGRVSAISLGVPQVGMVVSMDIYIMKKSLLFSLLQDCSIKGRWDLVSDVLLSNLKELKIFGYAYEGYVAIVNSLQSLYRHQMDLLKPEILQDLLFSKEMIHTKLKDGPPTRYCGGSNVKNSLIANGCQIEGSVEDSILFRKVRIGRGAVIRNSILMPKVEIGEDVVLDKVILDKGVCVKKGTKLLSDSEYPIVIEKNKVIGGEV